MATLHVFKCCILSCKYLFKEGKEANFINGKYYTSDPSEIAELNTEVEKGHPHISVDPKEVTIESELLNPVAALRAKLRAELLIELEADRVRNTDAKSDKGDTAGANSMTGAALARLKGIATSRDVADAASGSTSAASAG